LTGPPLLISTYEEIRKGGPVNWMVAGYRDTRDVIQFYEKGTGGFEEMRHFVLDKEEVLYIYVRLDDKYAVITFVSDHATGVKRARALVHGRSVAALFKENHLAITISSPAELTERHVRAQVRVESPTAEPPASSSHHGNSLSNLTRRKTSSSATISKTNLSPLSSQGSVSPTQAAASELSRSNTFVDRKTASTNKPSVSASESQSDTRPNPPVAAVDKVRSNHEVKQRNQDLKPPDDLKRHQKLPSQDLRPPVTTTITLPPQNLSSETKSPVNAQGWITELLPNYIWCRRLFNLHNQQLILYSCLGNQPKEVKRVQLKGLTGIAPCHDDIIIENSVRLGFDTGETLYFYLDNNTAKIDFIGRAMMT